MTDKLIRSTDLSCVLSNTAILGLIGILSTNLCPVSTLEEKWKMAYSWVIGVLKVSTAQLASYGLRSLFTSSINQGLECDVPRQYMRWGRRLFKNLIDNSKKNCCIRPSSWVLWRRTTLTIFSVWGQRICTYLDISAWKIDTVSYEFYTFTTHKSLRLQ